MAKNKKAFLKAYLLQQAKITRLKEMLSVHPEESEKYNAQIEKSLILRQEIEKKISEMDNEILKELLFQKYICGKTLEEISLIMNYSKRHVERLHIRAIDNLEL